ncbi:MAG TPA: hypothetical protein VLC95_06540 [Anaerolineae bacterium]|nr:hypothetical protein [Anaerolineae bacterium]
MLTLWLPLAASIVMMVLEPSIINIGLGRTADPELALAAYGVAFSLALLVEAPIIMLLDASVARSTDLAAFRLVRTFTFWLGIGVTAIGLLVSLTPLYDLIVPGLMRIPPDVAARARPTLQILSFWSFPIAWRRAHQGVLILNHRTSVITWATGVRLVSLAGAMYLGLLLLPERGAIVAGLAMDFSVIVESVLITAATRPVLRDPAYATPAEGAGHPMTMRDLVRFYWPLAGSTLLRQSTRSIINAGIALTVAAHASLAAWPVTWGFAILIAGPAWSLQQLTTAMAHDDASYARVRRFALALGALFGVLLALATFTPLYGWVMGFVYNLAPDLQALARPALAVMVLYPVLMGAQSAVRGRLIREGQTQAVQGAMALNVAALTAAVFLGAWLVPANGVVVAAAAMMIGTLAEQAFLSWRAPW